MPETLPRANLWRRFAGALYEGVLLVGVCFIFSYLYLTLTQQKYPLPELDRHFFQAYLFLAIGIYFLFFWCKSGQTLAMKTWHIRLVMRDGSALTSRKAALRYLLAWLSLAFCLFGYFWALLDREQQFLHDRLLGTRLIRTP